MSFLPGPMEDYNGEEVLYATGYTVDRHLIKQHYYFGLLLSITIVGAIVGLPVILRGFYLNRNRQKALILTRESFYEHLNKQVVWHTPISNIEKVLWRTSLMGFLEIKIITREGPNRLIKGNFYENEVHIIVNALKNRKS